MSLSLLVLHFPETCTYRVSTSKQVVLNCLHNGTAFLKGLSAIFTNPPTDKKKKQKTKSRKHACTSKYRILSTHLCGHPLGRQNGGLIGVRYASLAAALRHGRMGLHIYQYFVQYCSSLLLLGSLSDNVQHELKR